MDLDFLDELFPDDDATQRQAPAETSGRGATERPQQLRQPLASQFGGQLTQGCAPLPPNQRRPSDPPQPPKQARPPSFAEPPLQPLQPPLQRPPQRPSAHPPPSKRPRIPGPAAAFLPDGGGDAALLLLDPSFVPAPSSSHGQRQQQQQQQQSLHSAGAGGASQLLTQRAAAAVRADTVTDWSADCWLQALEAAGMPNGTFAPAGPPLQPSLHDITSGAQRGRVPRVVALVSALRRTPDGDAACSLTDPSGTVSAMLHADCLRSIPGGCAAVSVGCAIIATKVAVLIPPLDKRERILVVAEGCIQRVFAPGGEGGGAEHGG